jgi:hypothetical protein
MGEITENDEYKITMRHDRKVGMENFIRRGTYRENREINNRNTENHEYRCGSTSSREMYIILEIISRRGS